MKELHKQIVCDNPLTCRILNFSVPIEWVLFDHRKCFDEVGNFFVLHCLKEENRQIFFSIVQWSCKKDKEFFTLRYLRSVRDWQRKLTKRKVMKRKVRKEVMKRKSNQFIILFFNDYCRCFDLG